MPKTHWLWGTAMAMIANLHSVQSESFSSWFTLMENTISVIVQFKAAYLLDKLESNVKQVGGKLKQDHSGNKQNQA